MPTPVSMPVPSATSSATAPRRPWAIRSRWPRSPRLSRPAPSDKQFCAVGSVKSNIGHLDAGAGVVGLIKTALALKHGVLPPSLHFTAPNPQIDFASTPFYVNSKLTDWPRNGGPRRAGVSAFGVGGTNVHVVLEEAPAVESSAGSDPAGVRAVGCVGAQRSRPGCCTRESGRASARRPAGIARGRRLLAAGRTPRVRASLLCRRPYRRGRGLQAGVSARRIAARGSRSGKALPSRSCSRARDRSTRTWHATCTSASPNSACTSIAAPRFAARWSARISRRLSTPP